MGIYMAYTGNNATIQNTIDTYFTFKFSQISSYQTNLDVSTFDANAEFI